MTICAQCGLAADTPITVRIGDGASYDFDTFSCAVEKLAPRCPQCGRTYTCRATQLGELQLCSIACAQRRQIRQAWQPAAGEGMVDEVGTTPPRIAAPITPPPRRPSERMQAQKRFGGAHVGDVLIVRSSSVGRPPRRATILELKGPNGTPPYVVRWLDDGHEAFCYPGADATVERRHTAATR